MTHMRRLACRSILAWVLLLCVTGCSDNPVAPSVPLNEPFTLAPGTSASVSGASLVVQFLRVSGDSRCPGDAICIHAGDAIVHVRALSTAIGEYELHTGDLARSSVTHAGVRIALTGLQPYPFSSLPPIQPSDYRATFVVSR